MSVIVLLATMTLLSTGCEFTGRDPADEAAWIGGVRFDDVTAAAGVTRETQTYDAAIGDLNGDGFLDLYVGNHAAGAVLLRNEGDGTFRDVLADSGIEPQGDQHGAGLADFDNDGLLDLYVSMGAGRGLATKSNRFYRNVSGFAFHDVVARTGTGDPHGRSRAVAWLDADRDGLLDLVIANFASPNRLYLGRRDGTFEDVSEAWGIAELSATRIAWGDYDGDGFPDLLFSGTPQGLRLLRNVDGTRFQDVTRAAGLEPMKEAIQGMALGDFDNDGDLDLALSHGADFTEDVVVDRAGSEAIPSALRFAFFAHSEPVGFDFTTPASTTGLEVEFYENGSPVKGDRVRCGNVVAGAARFTCASAIAAQASTPEAEPSFLLWRDPEDQRDCPSCSARHRWHLRWRGPGDHHLSGLVHGGSDPKPIAIRTEVGRGSAVLRNDDGVFTRALDTADGGLPPTAAVNGQAVQWADVDADGWLDLYLVDSGIDGRGARNILLMNDEGRRFVAVPESAGATPSSGAGRGVAAQAFDYDRDGRLDLFLTNGWGAPPFDRGPYRLLRNTTTAGHWLALELRGRESNRGGLGAWISVEACGEQRTRYHNGDASYFSQSVTPPYFGLGTCTTVDAIEVRWPSGKVQRIAGGAVDRFVAIEEND